MTSTPEQVIAKIREASDLRRNYQEHLDRVNRATDAEIDEAMASILRDQRQRNVLRPAPRRSRTLLAGDNHEHHE